MADDAARPVVHLPGEGRAIDMGAFGMSLKADTAVTAGAFSLLEASEPPGFGPPLHVHEDCGEAFYVLEGLYYIFIEGEEFACPAGSFAYIPQGLEHGFRVGDVPSRKLNIYSPSAMVGYFDELAQAVVDDRVMDDEELESMAARYGMRVVGPVPEGYS